MVGYSKLTFQQKMLDKVKNIIPKPSWTLLGSPLAYSKTHAKNAIEIMASLDFAKADK